MKKLFALILTFALAFVLVGCGQTDKTNPSLTNGSDTFISISEDGVTYKVTNEELYGYLKTQYGTSVLVSMIDKELLTENGFLAKVKEEEIKAAIDEDVYGKDVEVSELDAEEKAELEKEFLDDYFVSNNIEAASIYDEAIKADYKLSLARKAYALEELKAEVKAHNEKYAEWVKLTDEEKEEKLAEYDALSEEEKAETEAPVTAPYFTDSKVSAKYAEENYNTYSAIVLPFASKRQAEIALNQFGVEVKDGVWAENGTALTAIQVYEKFVEIYTALYSYRLEEELNAESEEFLFKASELDSQVLAKLQDVMEIYGADSKNEAPKWYTPNALAISSGSQFVYVLKLAEKEVTAYADLTQEEKDAQRAKYEEALIKDALTANYVTTAVSKLHAEKEIVIYDSVLESAYIKTVSAYGITHETTEEEQANVVVKFGGKEITANQLFDQLVAFQGVAGALDKLAEKRLLNNSKFNKYYDVVNDKWNDADKKEEIEELIKSEKENFENGTYKEYGYDPATMSWEVFIKSLYNASNEKELVLAFLIETLETEYSKGLNYIVNTVDSKTFAMEEKEAELSDLWKFIYTKMEEAQKAKFSATGIHLLISHYATVEDYINGKNMIDPEEWTDEVSAAAQKLAEQVIEFVNNSKGTYQERLEKIVDAFKAAPQLNKAASYAGKEVVSTVTSTDGTVTINVSEYKELGLYVKFENLGTFTEGKMVEEFNDAVKEIWDADAEKDTFNDSDLTSIDKVTVYKEPIKTTYGYHVYINLKSNEISYITKTEGTGENAGKWTYTYMPSLKAIRQYTLNSDYAGLNPKEKTAITTYFKPIADELVSEGFTFVMKYTELNELVESVNCDNANVTKAKLSKYVELYKDYAFEDLLKTVTPEYIEKVR